MHKEHKKAPKSSQKTKCVPVVGTPAASDRFLKNKIKPIMELASVKNNGRNTIG